MILLDTHVVVWLLGDDLRLGVKARRIIAEDDERYVSAMVSWEIAMMVDKGRFAVNQPLGIWLEQSIDSIGAHEMVVTGAMACDAGSLAGDIHGDPCDRLMIATARAMACPLVTADRAILAYAAAGHVQAIDARV